MTRKEEKSKRSDNKGMWRKHDLSLKQFYFYSLHNSDQIMRSETDFFGVRIDCGIGTNEYERSE